MASLDVLPKGFRFPPTPLDIPAEWVRQYIEATEDESTSPLDPDLVPPMALATLAIRTLLNNARLPEGAVHAGQELEYMEPVPSGQDGLMVNAEIVSKGERSGWQLLTVRMSIDIAGGRPVMTARATLSMPVQ